MSRRDFLIFVAGAYSGFLVAAIVYNLQIKALNIFAAMVIFLASLALGFFGDLAIKAIKKTRDN